MSAMEREVNGYAARQVAKDARYEREYSAWIANLPPEERRKLADLGLDRPMPANNGASHCGLNGDIAESPVASERHDVADLVDEPEQRPPAQDLSSEALWDVLRRLIGEVLSMPNRSLTVECLAVVSGLSYEGDSMAEIARRHCVTRAAVSKRCVELTEKLSLMPARAMRSLTARRAYRAAQLKVRESFER